MIEDRPNCQVELNTLDLEVFAPREIAIFQGGITREKKMN